ncbi:molybdate ABC transporter permease subunit [Bacillus sp. FJAT-42376]|uniref:molybdate ABC transporter permease subunit n=1 Tax=Bacillus sp. FJAT-42376 TaxID=2014076 RepID=UPI000F5152DE|nr:molybdate ABC transporter permease subunit [Bacillus sp. FJAT-42376]AZB43115.1 molybdate ABC transporter permease subunit [Bacillus sp. FJAT-42376]
MAESFWAPVSLSIEIAIVSTIIVFFTGIGAAVWMARKPFKGKAAAETVLLLPLVLPPSVVGFLLIVFFGNKSPVGQTIIWLFGSPVMFTWWAGVIASSVVAFPLMYQSAKTGLESIDRDIEDAAKVDGANQRKVLIHISLPLASGSIVTGVILSFARALGEFGATLMFAGNIPGRTQTVPTAIYMAIDSGNMPLAWMWVLSIIGISFLMLSAVSFYKRN